MKQQEFRALIKGMTAEQKAIVFDRLWKSVKVVVSELAKDAKASKKPLPPVDLGSGRWN